MLPAPCGCLCYCPERGTTSSSYPIAPSIASTFSMLPQPMLSILETVDFVTSDCLASSLMLHPFLMRHSLITSPIWMYIVSPHFLAIMASNITATSSCICIIIRIKFVVFISVSPPRTIRLWSIVQPFLKRL